jgi:cytochrome c556
VAEAAALADHLRLLAASPEIAARPQSFRDLLAKSHAIAQRLEDQLNTLPSGDPARLSADMQALQATCKECHASARNQRSAPRDVGATAGSTAVTPERIAP